jgi:Ca-activated chloride channel homolog
MKTGYLDNFYARLGLKIDATEQEIKNSYHQAAIKFHPDTNHKGGSTEIFLQIQEAYETLSIPKQRLIYDKELPKDAKSFKDILTNTIFSRSALEISNSEQIIYALINFTAFPHNDPSINNYKSPINVSIVIDTSTSMKGERLEAVKSTSLKIIKNLRKTDYISIISFNDKSTVVLPSVQNPDMNIVESQISQLSTKGGTEIYQGLSESYLEIKKQLSSNKVNQIVLLTDGKTYGDKNKCISLAKELGENGISISGLGIGKDWNEDFLEELVKKTGGETVYAKDPSSIAKFMNVKFSQLNNTYATNIHLTYNLPKNVELKYVFRISPNTNSLSIDPLKFGDLQYDNNLSVLMEFLVKKVPISDFPFLLINGELDLTIPGKSIPRVSQKFNLMRPVAIEPPKDTPPQMLIRALSKISLYRLQEEAFNAVKNGHIELATIKLNNLATQLLVSGEPILADTVLSEIDKLEGGTNIKSEKERKQIKYGTRALLLPPGKEFP